MILIAYNIILLMFKLENLCIRLSQPLFTKHSSLYLRISLGNITKQTQSPAKIINKQQLEWDQSLYLPLAVNQQFDFQIFSKHEFGYNPQEFSHLLFGKMLITSTSQKSSTCEIYTYDKQRVGFLSSDVTSRNASYSGRNQSKINHLSSITEVKQKKLLKIVSIVGRTNSTIKRGYAVVIIGDKQIRSKVVRSNGGQFVFLSFKNIELEDSDKNAILKLYSVNVNNEEELIGEGGLQFNGSKPDRKLILQKQGIESGQILIDSKIMDQSKAKQLYNNSTILNSSQLTSSAQQHSLRRRSISPDIVRLEDFGIYDSSTMKPPMLNVSMDHQLSSRKKHSVVNQNSNIRFPKQKRFLIYQDKKNHKVSYLNEQSLEFRDPGAKKNYRGKSLGFGQKHDFTKNSRNVPGVGNYKLPSIWDRY